MTWEHILIPLKLLWLSISQITVLRSIRDKFRSVHFGASRSQITLHTGVLYFNVGEESCPATYRWWVISNHIQCKSFCSVSASFRHDPADMSTDESDRPTIHWYPIRHCLSPGTCVCKPVWWSATLSTNSHALIHRTVNSPLASNVPVSQLTDQIASNSWPHYYCCPLWSLVHTVLWFFLSRFDT